jgi:oligopeptide transport system ATP-binding protein
MSLFSVDKVCKSFLTNTGRRQQVLHDVTFQVEKGETLGLVGESGSGKSTIARCMLKLTDPDQGAISFDGMDVARARGANLSRFRREVQLVFQDPYASLNPRMTVGELIGEGPLVHGLERNATAVRQRAAELMRLVGLDPDTIDRYPQSFSGGQRQRIAIARALACRPRVLVCDEPVAALDVSVQAQVINLLQDMRSEFDLTVVFIAHDLAVVRHLCERIIVLHHGKIVEQGTRREIFEHPQMPYTQSLLAAVPIPDPVRSRRREAQHQFQ